MDDRLLLLKSTSPGMLLLLTWIRLGLTLFSELVEFDIIFCLDSLVVDEFDLSDERADSKSRLPKLSLVDDDDVLVVSPPPPPQPPFFVLAADPPLLIDCTSGSPQLPPHC